MSDSPFFEPTQDQRDLVIRAVKAGLDDGVIADLIGVSTTTLRKAFPTELLSGHERVMEVVDSLFQRAVDGHVPAAKLFLECRAGWIPKEKEQEVASKAVPLVIKMYDGGKIDGEEAEG